MCYVSNYAAITSCNLHMNKISETGYYWDVPKASFNPNVLKACRHSPIQLHIIWSYGPHTLSSPYMYTHHTSFVYYITVTIYLFFRLDKVR